MATTHRPRHHQAANVGRHRPQLDPPRFTQAPTHSGRAYQDFPLGPGAPPYRANLADLVGHLPDGVDKKMVFHICGDSGGVKNPAPQQLVASAMEADAANNTADGEGPFSTISATSSITTARRANIIRSSICPMNTTLCRS